MRVPRVYLDQPLQTGAELALDKAAAHYLVSVLRLRANDALLVFNGSGGEYTAVLQAATNKQATITIGDHSTGVAPSPIRVVLAIGLSRGERMDWVVQKAVELGVNDVIPLFTERCEVKLKGERALKKLGHWQQIAISACEQSQRNDVPLIKPMLALSDFLASMAPPLDSELALLLDPTAEQSLSRTLLKASTPVNSIVLLSGPEGGFSAAEVALAQQKGLLSVGLGPRVLRTETAPLAALSIVQALLGDLG
ncbi:MAG: 16S rRNA (uracil(1498)-N(3))-methyltransferase [Gammaproteobacteria bacterium]|nr:16S rRNA (uracil(1498)-N(3))-methyltransferase [Gammaproteobacteria bacterium]MBQ0840890.1 16S rRNA (uracil(1498)-N(3))-methyltransferase [Gammaproteobacteria bacterium]